MTPKEKAKDLVQIFARLHRGLDDTFQLGDVWFDELDKQCALICVDEIISKGGTKNVIQYEPNCFTNGVEYWQEVKREIKIKL